jgi:hypothetical protein
MEKPGGVALAHGDLTGQILAAFFEVLRSSDTDFQKSFTDGRWRSLRTGGMEAGEEVLLHVHFRGTLTM